MPRFEGSPRTPPSGSPCMPPPDRFMIWSPIRWYFWAISSRTSSSVLPFSGLKPSVNRIRSGAIAQAPTIQADRAVALWTSPPTPVEFSP